MQVDTTLGRPNSREAALKAELAAIVGADHVRDDDAIRDLHSEDIFSVSAHRVALVVSPRTLLQTSAVVAAATGAGFAVAPRGAGMSYTSGYIPATADGISLDLSALNRVLAISAEDMTVTVEAGCTWAALNQALAPHGLRTPFWGPMSGLTSTVGGGLSQLNAMLGAGHYGTSSESVIALTVVLADGRILRTGARGPDGNTPFYRHYGPDLAGLFCGDSGVFAIKAEITLRLIRAPAHEDYASFEFASGKDLLHAMAEMARADVASEMCAFDPGLTKIRLARASLVTDVKTLGAVARRGGVAGGVLAAAKIMLGGRRFASTDAYPLHVIADGRSAAGVAADMAEARRIARRFAGRETLNTVAKVIRAVPFPPLNSVVGPSGQAWLPVHGNVSLSNAPAVFADIEALLVEDAAEFERLGISTAYLFTTLSTNAITIEPVFYWPAGWRPIHASAAEPSHLARLTRPQDSPAATAAVRDARARIIGVFERYGCAHFQIGRAYPYRASRDAASVALLDAIKADLDPAGRLNPGGLGFPAAQ